MAKIDFDFKAYLLQKGERVGLIVAGVLAAIMVLVGLGNAFSSSSPDKNADVLKKNIDGKRSQLRAATPPPDYPAANLDPSLLADVQTTPVSGAEYALSYPPIDSRPVDDNKRRQPRLLEPDEWAATVARLRMRSIQLWRRPDGDRVMVVKGDTSSRGGAGSLN